MEEPTRVSAYMLWLLDWCFCGTPNSGNGGNRWLFCLFLDLFPPTGLTPAVLSWGLVPSFSLSWYNQFGQYLQEACSFLKGNKGGIDDGEGWEESTEWKMRLGYIKNNNNKIIGKNKKTVFGLSPKCHDIIWFWGNSLMGPDVVNLLILQIHARSFVFNFYVRLISLYRWCYGE